MESRFHHASPMLPPVKSPCLSLLHHARVFLVSFCIEILIGGRLRPQCIYFFLPLQTMVWHPPHTFRPGHAPSPISLLPQMPTFGWLLCCPTKRWPPKAKVTSLSLIFDVLHFSAPKEGKNSNKSTPNAARLVWAHRDQRRQDLDPWWMFPWRERAKAVEG